MSSQAKKNLDLASSAQPLGWRQTKRKIHVVLPAYNEAENLGALLERIDDAMREEGYGYEVIVVDDGSRDLTPEIATRYATLMPVRLERHEVNSGLGATIRDGLKIAAETAGDQDVIIAMDADNSHGPGLISTMVRLIREGNDVVIASRYQYGAYTRGVPFHRLVLSSVASLLFRFVFPIRGVKDYTCGYRAYRGSLLKKAFQTYGKDFVSQDGFECMVDILLKLRAMDAIIREVPLILRYDEKGGASKMKVFRTIRRTLALMFKRRLGA